MHQFSPALLESLEMSDLNLAQRHRLLPATRRGDTLIIEPIGSMGGFTPSQVREERVRIERLLAEPETANLIIDLGSADYYGSQMIAMFLQLRESCQGTTALANVSNDMEVVLETMGMDELFELYGSQPQAVKAVAKIPLRERIRINNRFVKYIVVPALLIALGVMGWQGNYIYQLTGTTTQRQYEHINALWTDYQERPAKYSEAESMPRQELIGDLDRLIERSVVNKKRSADEENLMQAMMNFRAIVKFPAETEKRTPQFMHHMQCARNGINRHTGIDLPRPRQTVAMLLPAVNG